LTYDRAVDTAPAWSPDGRQIAFVSSRGNPAGNSSLYLMQADGSAPHRLNKDGPEALNEVAPAWSPSAQVLVFGASQVRSGAQGFQLHLIGVNGQAQTQIQLASPEPALTVASPAWQP
jgi:Tol biopolymer transport system component